MNEIDLDALRRRIYHMVSAKRFGHIRGVEQTAMRLAEKFGADPQKAELAGILHDAMRGKSGDELLSMAKEYGILIDDYLKANPDLLHGPVAAAWAERELGIRDEEILEAIRAHTIGDDKMEPLTCILYLADAMEPGRRYEGVEDLRRISQTDLKRATLLALEQSKDHVLEKGKSPHPQSECAQRALLKKIEEEQE